MTTGELKRFFQNNLYSVFATFYSHRCVSLRRDTLPPIVNQDRSQEWPVIWSFACEEKDANEIKIRRTKGALNAN